MKEPIKKLNRWKVIGVGLLGIMLFSASMAFLFDFKSPDLARADPNDLITVKDGLFSFLDNNGYNFEFQCEINQILIVETERYISDNEFIMVSNNSFGITTFTFDYLDNGDVKFTIDHKGNMIRDHWFRITIKDIGFRLFFEESVLSWSSGSFDYSDMSVLDNFWLDQSDSSYWLSVKFLNSRDFWIDPLLSQEILVGDVAVSVYDKLNIVDSDFYEGSVGYWDFEEAFESIPLSEVVSDVNVTRNDTMLGTVPSGYDEGILNPSFESDFDNWTDSGSAWLYTTNPDRARTGVQCVGYANGAGYVEQNITDILVSEVSEISYYGKQFEASAGVGVRVIYNDTTFTEEGFTITGYDVWQKKSVNLGLLSSGKTIDAIRLYWILNTPYIDDVSLHISTYTEESNVTIVNNQVASSINIISSYVEHCINYSIELPSYHSEYPDTSWTGHNNSFYISVSWNLINVTFGNGTVKTSEDGFSISSFNSSHNKVLFFAGEVNGTYIWFFDSEITWVLDSSGNGHNGTHALNYDSDTYNSTLSSFAVNNTGGGTWDSEKVDLGNSSDFYFGDNPEDDTMNNPFSIGYWLKFADANSEMGNAIGKTASNEYSVGEWKIGMTNSRQNMFIDSGTGLGDYTAYMYRSVNQARPGVSDIYANGIWYFFVFTYGGEMDYLNISFYEDGVKRNADKGWEAGTLTPFNQTNDHLTFGNTNTNNRGLDSGTEMDDVSLWDRELTVRDIEYMYFFTHTYLLTDSENNDVGKNYGYLTNGSNQIQYKINYTVLHDETLDGDSTGVVDRYHQFLIPHNYSFVNVTLPNGTLKTVESGFTIDSYNSTHDLVNITDIIDNGTFTWFFVTDNAIAYLDINPRYPVNGTLTNQSEVFYYIRVANGSVGLINYPVTIEVKHSDETVVYEEDKLTGANGWLNSSFDSQLEMYSDYKFWFCVTGTNTSFMGYAVDYYMSYNDWTEPVISQIDYDADIIENNPFILYLYVSDDFTLSADLTVHFYYSTISSGSLDDYYSLVYVSGNKFELSIAGKSAETTMWFQIRVWDNLSNLVQTSIYQIDWIVPPAGDSGDDGGGNGVSPIVASTPSAGGDSTVMILLFIAGGVMVAVLGYAVFKRTQVRTREVKTTEVITGFGGFGSTTETKIEKGEK